MTLNKIWKLRPTYSPETPNLGKKWCFVPCDLEIWWMTLENNRASLLCCFTLCATFHSHRWIQTGVTVRKCPIRVKFEIKFTFLRGVWGWWWSLETNNFFSIIHHDINSCWILYQTFRCKLSSELMTQGLNLLTHWGLNKMPAIFGDEIFNCFFSWITWLTKHHHQFSYNDLAQNRRQIIIWTNRSMFPM